MKGLRLLLAVLLAVGLAHTALASAEMELVSGGSTVLITDNGAGDLDSTVGTITYSNTNLNGWVISVTSGTSNSPGVDPFGIDLTSLTATCASGKPCSTDSLQVWFGDTSFNVPATGFQSDYSATITGSSASTSQKAWVDNTNTILGTGSLIGTIGPFTSTGSGTVFGGGAGIPPYSLTLEQIFSAGGHSASFSADGNITAVPEPGAVVLLGTALVLCASGLRRKRVS